VHVAQPVPQVRGDLDVLAGAFEGADVTGAGPRQRHRHDLGDPAGAGAHQHHAIAEQHRLFHAVGDEHDRQPVFLPDRQQLLLQQPPGLLVHRPERLVHEQHLRLHREGAGDADPLLHAAGQLAGPLGLETRQPHHADQRAGAFGPFGLADAAHP
jgi:hypothetical protein